jgi:hypothetical protein
MIIACESASACSARTISTLWMMASVPGPLTWAPTVTTDRMEVRTQCCCELCCPFDHVMSCLGGVRRNENWSGHGYILADQMTGEHQGLSCSPSFRSEQRARTRHPGASLIAGQHPRSSGTSPAA